MELFTVGGDGTSRRKTVLYLAWYVLSLELLRLAGSSGDGPSGDGPVCLHCPASQQAQCAVRYDSRTIACSWNASGCDGQKCRVDQNCFVHFFRESDVSWTFSSSCFNETFGAIEGGCVLKTSFVPNTSFPPVYGVECHCRSNCSLDQPLVYVHPSQLATSSHVAPSSASSPPLINSTALYTGPMPTTALSLPLDCTTGCVVGSVVGGMVVMVTVMVLCILILGVVWKRRKSTQRHSRSFRNRRGLRIPSDEEPPFQLGHLVSRGRYGYVYRTEYEGELVAVKIFSHQNRISWENERTLFGMQSTSHRNVIACLVEGMWGSGCQLQMFIVAPYFPLGSLNRFLARNTVSWEQACRVVHSVTCGLGHLHAEAYLNSDGVSVEKYSVAHRDIKSANVLVRGENGDCVISDLGFALILDPTRDEKDMANTGQVGTYRYMAPEVLDARISLQDIQAFKQIDIYALALVMWEVVWRCNVQQEESPREYLMAYQDTVGQRPGIDTMRDLVCIQKMRPRILPVWRNHPGLSSLVDTVEECWDEDPEARLSASNIILRLRELVDGGPSSLASDHTPSHTFSHPPVVPGNEQYRLSEALESTTDTIGTTDSRPPPYDSRWSYLAATNPARGGEESDGSSSVSTGLNLEETTV